MLNMIAGAEIEKPENLYQRYEMSDNKIRTNVDAENIQKVIDGFLRFHEGQPLFLFIEAPASLGDETSYGTTADGTFLTEKLHRDAYYLDGISAAALQELLGVFYEILIQDGLSAFGIGTPSGDEVGKYKYNVMVLYSKGNLGKYRDIFEEIGIPQTEHLVTAWETFTEETPGKSELYRDSSGRCVYDIIDVLSEEGLYKAGQVEE